LSTVVADTQALAWYVTEPARLGPGARRGFAACEESRSFCHVPVVALMEIWMLLERGRVLISPPKLLEAIERHSGFSVLDLDLDQALEFGALTAIRDPMDRMIVAAARATGSRLISSDAKLSGHGIERIWD
jgi:PIN domain nuclease of toxin-antitoxin system